MGQSVVWTVWDMQRRRWCLVLKSISFLMKSMSWSCSSLELMFMNTYLSPIRRAFQVGRGSLLCRFWWILCNLDLIVALARMSKYLVSKSIKRMWSFDFSSIVADRHPLLRCINCRLRDGTSLWALGVMIRLLIL